MGTCPYPLSPGGEGALWPANWAAVQLWQRFRALGPVALEGQREQLTPADWDELVEKLYVLETAQAQFQRQYSEVKLLWESS